MISHASNPVAEQRGNGLLRVYFSSRDQNNRSSIGWVEIDIREPHKILSLSEKPVLGPGEIGTFNDSGSSMGCLVQKGDTQFLYYLGWNLGVTVPWRNSIGLARRSASNGSFEIQSKAPVLDRNPFDPYSVSYPWVLRDQDCWRMWYGSNLKWGPEQKDMAHLIKYAESTDGIHWLTNDQISVNFKNEEEYALSKPCIIKENGVYRMWYSYRGKGYRIGYAESGDGIHFERMDQKAGIDISVSGWDSETVEYPCVFDLQGTRFLLYNGNRYGLTGFGLAVLEKP